MNSPFESRGQIDQGEKNKKREVLVGLGAVSIAGAVALGVWGLFPQGHGSEHKQQAPPTATGPASPEQQSASPVHLKWHPIADSADRYPFDDPNRSIDLGVRTNNQHRYVVKKVSFPTEELKDRDPHGIQLIMRTTKPDGEAYISVTDWPQTLMPGSLQTIDLLPPEDRGDNSKVRLVIVGTLADMAPYVLDARNDGSIDYDAAKPQNGDRQIYFS